MEIFLWLKRKCVHKKYKKLKKCILQKKTPNISRIVLVHPVIQIMPFLKDEDAKVAYSFFPTKREKIQQNILTSNQTSARLLGSCDE